MSGLVYTFVSVGTSDQNDGAIEASQGTFSLGGSGLLTTDEYQDAVALGLQIVEGPAASPAPQLTAPTAAAGAAGSLNGAYKYVVTFVTAAGETKGGPEATVSVTNTEVSLTAIPVGDPTSGVTARKVYRTSAGGSSGTEKLVATINDNTTTTYTDSTADGSLGTAVPASDTSFVDVAATGSYVGDE